LLHVLRIIAAELLLLNRTLMVFYRISTNL